MKQSAATEDEATRLAQEVVARIPEAMRQRVAERREKLAIEIARLDTIRAEKMRALKDKRRSAVDIDFEDFNWVAQQAVRAALSGAETLVQAFDRLVREERFNEDEITEARATLQNFLDTQGLAGTLARPPQTIAPVPSLNEPKIVVTSDLLQHVRDEIRVRFPEMWNQMSPEERSSHLHSTAREVSRIRATFAGKLTPSEATSAAIEMVIGLGEEAEALEHALLDEMDIQDEDEDYDAAHERFLLSFFEKPKQSE